MSTKKILITGGTGFAGSHLVEALLAAGQTNIHVTSFSGEAGYVGTLLSHSSIHACDLTNYEQTANLLRDLQPDQIYHLASFAVVGSSFEKANEVISNNVTLQLSILEAMKRFAPKARLLSIGSADSYEPSTHPRKETDPLRPSNPYAVSKMTQELLSDSYARRHNLDVVLVRPFNHLGERQTPQFVIASFAHQIAAIEKGQQFELQVGNLTAIRDFTDVQDVVKAYILLMESGKSGEVYNIGSGKGIQISDVLELLTKVAHANIPIVHDPSRVRPIDVPYVVADISKISALGWHPTIPLLQTLERVLNYWRTQP